MNPNSAEPQRESNLPKPLRGIVAPIITPLLTSGDLLDTGGLERLLDHILSGGVTGLLVLGSTGEAPSLSHALRREVITTVCRHVGNRAVILIGLIDSCASEILAMAEHAAKAGAHGLVVSSPFYFPLSQSELLGYIQRLVPRLPLPVYLYNIPQMTKVPFEFETLAELVANPRILGIKDSSGEMPYVERVLQLKSVRPEWSVLVGSDHLLLEGLRRGADGGVTGGAVFHPHLFSRLFAAAIKSETEMTHSLQQEVLNACRLYSVNPYSSGVVRAIKCACNLLGLCSDIPAEPFQPFDPHEREQVGAILKSAGLLT